MSRAMRWFLTGGALLFGIALSSAADARLLGESVQGARRVCVYDSGSGYTSSTSRTRSVQIGLGQNCPANFPGGESSAPPPSSAMLQSDTVDGRIRRCVYEQLGFTWQRSITIRSRCPAAAGMLGSVAAPSPNDR
jgi:hypothetical protein